MNGNTIGFRPQTQKLELHTRSIVPCESTAEEISSTDSKVREANNLVVKCCIYKRLVSIKTAEGNNTMTCLQIPAVERISRS